MKEIIEISENRIGDNSVKTVLARNLYNKLGSKDNFSNWIQAQFKRGGFVENIDFVKFWSYGEKPLANIYSDKELLEKFGNTHRARALGLQTDYFLTLDTAKHIALMSGTEKGRDIRNYFIEVERAYQFEISKSMESMETVLESREKLTSISEKKANKELRLLKTVFETIELSQQQKIDLTNRVLERINFPTIRVVDELD